MNTYTVIAANKKSVEEIIKLSNTDHPEVTLLISAVYSTGEWEITPETDEELSRLMNHDHTKGEFDPDNFGDSSIVELFDVECREGEFTYPDSMDTEKMDEMLEELESQSDDWDQWLLLDLGWSEDEVTTTIHGPIEVVVI